MMTKGRKRMNRERYPSGRVREEPATLVAEVAKLRHVVSRHLREPALATQTGELWLRRDISDHAFEAFKAFYGDRRSWEAVKAPVRSSPAAQDLNRVRGQTPDSPAAIRAAERYAQAVHILRHEGPLVEAVTRRVIEDRDAIGGEPMLVHYRRGLDALAVFYGFARGRK